MKQFNLISCLILIAVPTVFGTTVLNAYCMASFGPANGWHALLIPGFCISVLGLGCSLKFHTGSKLGWTAALVYSLWSQLPCLFLGFLLYGLFMEFQLQLLASIMLLYFLRRCSIVMGSNQPLEAPLLILMWLQVWLTQDALKAFTEGDFAAVTAVEPVLAVFMWLLVGTLLSIIVTMASLKKSLTTVSVGILYKSIILHQIILWIALAGLHYLDRQHFVWVLLTQGS